MKGTGEMVEQPQALTVLTTELSFIHEAKLKKDFRVYVSDIIRTFYC